MTAGHILYVYGLLPLGEHSSYAYIDEVIIFTPQELPDHEAEYELESVIL